MYMYIYILLYIYQQYLGMFPNGKSTMTEESVGNMFYFLGVP
jgi:hypothetical protein